ncbi:metallophosphoesterase [Hippea alviniae]|uniref:metallophosphoesterase n=1 Tax=Hippea alviniae TaxID=1279027 RepID=UPI0003B2E3E6|nr:metallophosphoesterase [Hippea alviniae]
MRIGIISDSHDNIEAIKLVVDLLNKESVDLTIHLGDIVSPFCFDYFDKLNSKFIGVFGNNDGEVLFLQQKSEGKLHKPPFEIELDGKEFILMHEPFGIDKLAREYNYVLYGHLHRIDLRETEKGYIINPGELCGCLTNRRTLVILDTKKNEVSLRVV